MDINKKKIFIYVYLLSMLFLPPAVYAVNELRIVTSADTPGNNYIDKTATAGSTFDLELWLESDTFINGMGIYLDFNDTLIDIIDMQTVSGSFTTGVNLQEDSTTFGDVFLNQSDSSSSPDTIYYAALSNADSVIGSYRIAVMRVRALANNDTAFVTWVFDETNNHLSVIAEGVSGDSLNGILTDSAVIRIVPPDTPVIDLILLTSTGPLFVYAPTLIDTSPNGDTIWFNPAGEGAGQLDTFTVLFTDQNPDSLTGSQVFSPVQTEDTTDSYQLSYRIPLNSGPASVLITITDLDGNLDTVPLNFLPDTTAPGTAALVSPASTVHIDSNQPVFEWSAVTDTGSGVREYLIEISTAANFSIITMSGTTAFGDTDFYPGSTLADTVYYWRVIVSDNVNNTDYATVQVDTLAVDTQDPETVTLIAPADLTDTRNRQPEFSWTTALDTPFIGVTYRIQISTDNNFGITTFDSTTTAETFVPDQNLAGGTFFWRVRSEDLAGNTSAYSTSTWSIMIDYTPPSVVTLLSPLSVTETNVTQPQFSWTASSDTQSSIIYNVQISSDPSFATTDIDSQITSSTYVPPSVFSDTTYFWRVNVGDNAGNTTGFTSSETFIIDVTPPATPVNIAPADTSFIDSALPVLTWSTANDTQSGTIYYRVQVSTSNAFTLNIVDSVVTTNTSVVSNYLNNDTYFMRVFAFDEAGNTSGYSTITTFVVDTSAPVIASITITTDSAGYFYDAAPVDTTITGDTVFFNSLLGNGQNDTITVVWSDAYPDTLSGNAAFGNGAQADTIGSNGWNIVYTLNLGDTDEVIVVTVTDIAGKTDTVPILFLNDTAGPNPTPLVSPSNGSTTGNTTPTFAWLITTDTRAGVQNYTIQISSRVDFAFFDDQYTTTALSYTSTTLVDSIYYWKVIALDNVGNTGVSATYTVTIDSSVPVITAIAISSTASLYFYPDTPISVFDSGDTVYFNNTGAGAGQLDSITVIVSDNNPETVAGDSVLTPVYITDNDSIPDFQISYIIDAGATDTTVYVVVTDLTGFQDTVPLNFIRDVVAPSTPALYAPLAGSGIATDSPVFAWVASTDTLSGIREYKIMISTRVNFSTYISDTTIAGDTDYTLITPLNDTIYYWRVVAIDNVNNQETSTVDTFTVDTTRPDTPVLSAPATGTSTSSLQLSLSWSASTDTGSIIYLGYDVQVSTDPNFSIISYNTTNITATNVLADTLTANETYYWRVMATDDAGNTSDYSLSFMFIVDTMLPVIQNETPTAGSVINNTSPLIGAEYSDTIAGINVSSSLIWLDTGNGYVDMTASATSRTGTGIFITAQLNSGVNTALVAVSDSAATRDTFIWTFTLDTFAATPDFLNIFDGYETNVTSIDISGTTTETGDSIELWVDGALVSTDTSGTFPFAFNNISIAPEGTHPVWLVAFDTLGNRSGTKSITITLDTSLPQIISETPTASSTIVNTSPVIGVQFNDTVTGINVPTAVIWLDSGNGYVDMTASAISTTNTGIFIQAQINAGINTALVAVSDSATNRDTLVWTFTLDTGAAIPDFLNIFDGYETNVTPIDISGTTTETGDSIELWIDGALVLTDTSGTFPFTFTNVSIAPEGTHPVWLVGIDAIGNRSSTKSITITLDTSLPQIISETPAVNSTITNTSPVMGAQYYDTITGINVPTAVIQLDSGNGYVNMTATAISTTNTGIFIQVTVRVGTNSVRVVVADSATNYNTNTWTFTVDTGATMPDFLNIQNGYETNVTSIDITGTSTETGDSIELWVDGALVTTDTSGTFPFTFNNATITPEGTHPVWLVAVDVSGNRSNTNSIVITIDTSLPQLLSETPTVSSIISSTTPVIGAQYYDTITGINVPTAVIRLDSGNGYVDMTASAVSLTNTGIFINALVSEGINTALVAVSDSATNRDTLIWNFTVDTSLPQIISETPTASSVISNTIPMIGAQYYDTVTGVSVPSAVIWLDTGNGYVDMTASAVSLTNTGIFINALAGSGVNTALVAVSDSAANRDTLVWTFTIDTTLPQIISETPAASSVISSTIPLTGAQYYDTATGINVPSAVIWLDSGLGYVDMTASAVSLTNTGIFINALVGEGVNTALVAVSDSAANRDTLVWTFTVDTSLPQIISETPTASSTISSTIPIIGVQFNDTVTGINVPSAVIWIDTGNGYVDMTATAISLTNTGIFIQAQVSIGTNTGLVAVSDSATNRDTLVWTFTVNAGSGTVPTPIILNPVTGTDTNITSVDVIGTTTQLGDTMELWVDSGFVTNTTSIVNLTFTFSLVNLGGPGAHQISLVGENSSGVRSGTATVVITLDTTTPSISSETPADLSTTTSTQPLIGAQYSDTGVGIALATVVIRLDSGIGYVDMTAAAVSLTGTGVYIQPTLGNGGATAQVIVADSATNYNTFTWTFTVNLSGTVPAPAFVNLTSGMDTNVANIDIVGTTTRLGDTIELFVDNVLSGSAIVAALPFTFLSISIAPEGSHQLSLVASDTSTSATTTITITLDITQPLVASETPADLSTITNTQPLVGAMYADAGVGVAPGSVLIRMDTGGGYLDLTASAVVSNTGVYLQPTLGNGSATAQIILADSATNYNTFTWTFTVDLSGTVPAPSFLNLTTGTDTNVSVINVVGTTTRTGDTIELWVDSGLVAFDITGLFPFTFNAVTLGGEGYHQLSLVATNLYSARSSTATVVINLDSTPPTISSETPTSSSIVIVNPVLMGATYADTGVGLALGTVRIELDTGNGYIDMTASAVIFTSTGIYLQQSLSNGTAGVRVVTADSITNYNTFTWTFTMALPDSVVPTINSSSISVSTVTNSGTEFVTFTIGVMDTGGVAGVTIDFSLMGGDSATPLYNDGTNGDTLAGDSIFALTYNIADTVIGDTYYLVFTVSDSSGNRTSGGTVILVVIDITPSYAPLISPPPYPDQTVKVAGGSLSVVSDADPAATSRVLFYYRVLDNTSSIPGAWILFDTDTLGPHFASTFNVDTYSGKIIDFLAESVDNNGNTDPSPLYLRSIVDLIDYDVDEYLTAQNERLRLQRISTDTDNLIAIVDGTEVEIPAGTLSKETFMRVLERTTATAPAPNVMTGLSNINSYRQITLDDGTRYFNNRIQIFLSYLDDNQDGLVDGSGDRESTLWMYFYDENIHSWVRLDNSSVDTLNNQVSAYVNHLTLFAVFGNQPADNLDNLVVYPNPFKPNDGNDNTGKDFVYGDQASGIVFSNVPSDVKIRIYDVTGRLVSTINASNTGGNLQWDAKNDFGFNVASGVYTAIIKSGNQVVSKRIMIIR